MCTKFNLTKSAFDYVLHNLNTEFAITLTKNKPQEGNTNIFALAIDNNEDIKLWIKLDNSLYKAKPSLTSPLKWLETEHICTETKSLWWLSAVGRPNIKNSDKSDVYIELLDDLSATTI